MGTYAWCTEHGFQRCLLVAQAGTAYARRLRKAPKPYGLIMTAIDSTRPDHAAVYTRAAAPKEARACLRSVQRSARARATRRARASG